MAGCEATTDSRQSVDRFIIATAKLNDLTVVTADERFEEYGLAVVD
ncbi:MAG: PIN domain-containing protein [Verrucomicrobiota bacterium]